MKHKLNISLTVDRVLDIIKCGLSLVRIQYWISDQNETWLTCVFGILIKCGKHSRMDSEWHKFYLPVQTDLLPCCAISKLHSPHRVFAHSDTYVKIILPLLGIYLEKTIIWKDTCTPMFTAALFTLERHGQRNSERRYIKYVFIRHNGILLSIKIMKFAATWIDGPSNFHTKWSKSEKDKYHMILVTCGIWKKRYK